MKRKKAKPSRAFLRSPNIQMDRHIYGLLRWRETISTYATFRGNQSSFFFSRKANLWRSYCYYCFFAYIKIENHSVCFPLSLRLNEPPYDSTCVSTHACMSVCLSVLNSFFISFFRTSGPKR